MSSNVAGSSWVAMGGRGFGYLFCTLIALGVMGLVGFVVYADLIWLGPDFLFAIQQATIGQVDIAIPFTRYLPIVGDGVTDVQVGPQMAYILSIATSGYLYILGFGIAHGRRFWRGTREDKIAIAVPSLVGIPDAFMDVGGMTNYFLGPQQGLQIIPDNPTTDWWFWAVLTFIFCGFHEFIFAPLLEMAEDGRAGSFMPGAFIINKAILVTGLLFSVVRAASILVAVAAIFLLNLSLSAYCFKAVFSGPNVSGEMGTSALSWGIPAAIMVCQVMLFRRVRIMRAAKGLTPLDAVRSTPIVASFVIAAMGLDTVTVFFGLNLYLYGMALPESFSVAWLLLQFEVVWLCMTYEYVGEHMLAQAKKIDRKKAWSLFRRKTDRIMGRAAPADFDE